MTAKLISCIEQAQQGRVKVSSATVGMKYLLDALNSAFQLSPECTGCIMALLSMSSISLSADDTPQTYATQSNESIKLQIMGTKD